MEHPQSNPHFWRKCSSCKKEIGYQSLYFICSVSTCQHKRTGLIFCSVNCWDAHLGFAAHRESAALEKTSPRFEEFSKQNDINPIPQRKIIRPSPMPNNSFKIKSSYQGDTLVVVSKIKKLIKDETSLNTSQCAIDELTEIVAKLCLEASEHAIKAGRKTLMGRDF